MEDENNTTKVSCSLQPIEQHSKNDSFSENVETNTGETSSEQNNVDMIKEKKGTSIY